MRTLLLVPRMRSLSPFGVSCLLMLSANLLHETQAASLSPQPAASAAEFSLNPGRMQRQVLDAGPYAGTPAEVGATFLREQKRRGEQGLDSLELRRVIPLGKASGNGFGPGGAILRYVQRVQGIPVMGDALILSLSAEGRVQGMQQRLLETASLERALAGPRLTQAQAFVQVQAGRSARPLGGALVFWRSGSGARLVWEVSQPPLAAGAEGWQVLVDATSGQVLRRLSLRDHESPPELEPPLANVYRFNPFVESELETVSLGAGAAEALTSDNFTLLRCEDQQERVKTVDLSGQSWWAHVCTVVPAPGPVDGNYLFEPLPYPEDIARDEDQFGGPHLFYHLEALTPFLAHFGLEDVSEYTIEVTANMRQPNTLDATLLDDPEAPLAAYNNAYFMSPYRVSGILSPPKLVFGQGSTSDFAYDADVVYHELTHGAVFAVGGPRMLSWDGHGISIESSALNEGFADYFSSIRQGDPVVGEYAGLRWAPEGGGIRNLELDARCPNFLVGQQHNDSQPWSGALWEIRTALTPEQAQVFDQVVFNVLAELADDASLQEATAALLARVEQEMDAETLGLAQTVVAERGLPSCQRLVPIQILGSDTVSLEYTQVLGRDTFGSAGGIPGTIQLEVEVPEGSHVLVVQFMQPEYKGVKLPDFNTDVVPATLQVLRRHERPVSWNYAASGSFNAEPIRDEATVAQKLESTPLETTSYLYPAYEARLTIAEEPGKHYLQFMNMSTGGASIYDLTLRLDPAPEPSPTPVPEGDGGGCGCAQADGASKPLNGGLLSLLGLLGLLAGRRKRS
ncbi:MAG: MYXO-CTERM sorting domain-containing protein [Myxococcota bacterium]